LCTVGQIAIGAQVACCYGNIAFSEYMLVLAVCLVIISASLKDSSLLSLFNCHLKPFSSVTTCRCIGWFCCEARETAPNSHLDAWPPMRCNEM